MSRAAPGPRLLVDDAKLIRADPDRPLASVLWIGELFLNDRSKRAFPDISGACHIHAIPTQAIPPEGHLRRIVEATPQRLFIGRSDGSLFCCAADRRGRRARHGVVGASRPAK